MTKEYLEDKNDNKNNREEENSEEEFSTDSQEYEFDESQEIEKGI